MTVEEIHQQLAQDRRIDPSALDVEAVRQADTFCQWAELLAKTEIDLERKKHANDALYARLELRCRREPEKFRLDKVSEAGVKAAVLCCDKYMDAMREYFDLAEVVEQLKVAVRTMDMKKRMLENLTTLHGQQYFAGPSTPKNLVDAWARYSKQSEQRVNDKQREGARRRVQRELD